LTPNPKRLRNHLGGWQAQLPQGFHLFVFENKQKSDLDIYNGFISSRQISDIAKYDTTKEKIIEYIKLVRSAF